MSPLRKGGKWLRGVNERRGLLRKCHILERARRIVDSDDAELWLDVADALTETSSPGRSSGSSRSAERCWAG